MSSHHTILNIINSTQASENTKFHCLFAHFYLGISVNTLAYIYHKSKSTIYNWINQWDEIKSLARRSGDRQYRKFNEEKRGFILEVYQHFPTSFLDEVRDKFIQKFGMNISSSTIWRVIDDAGLTRKVIERRAIEISTTDIIRFFNDLLALPQGWIYENLVFLDEVGFDNRDMLRKYGYALKGQRIYYRGESTRKQRCSLLCFLGVDGLLECNMTDGTFDRFKFLECCRNLALSGSVYQYPGRNSVWILDGASIHRDPNIVYYLRSLGIYPIFLPAYCPFFNPIEIVFGLIKSHLQRNYVENRSQLEMKTFIAQTLTEFKFKNNVEIFKKCGYVSSSVFNPGVAFSQNLYELGFEDTATTSE